MRGAEGGERLHNKNDFSLRKEHGAMYVCTYTYGVVLQLSWPHCRTFYVCSITSPKNVHSIRVLH